MWHTVHLVLLKYCNVEDHYSLDISSNGETRNAQRILVAKPVRGQPHGRQKS